MSEAFDSIKQGLEEAIDYSKGSLRKAVVHKFKPIDVKNIRRQQIARGGLGLCALGKFILRANSRWLRVM